MTRSSQPLDPQLSIDPTAVTSFTAVDNHTGVFLDADGVNNSMLVRTADTNALYIDKYQNFGINTIDPKAQLDVSAPDGRCIQITYNGTSNTGTLAVASDGKMTMSAAGSEVNIDSANNFNVKSHNGSTAGLKLNGTLVQASADQLNYTTVTSGTAAASKALVVDANRDITNIRGLTASYLTGTLQTGSQPNITATGTLDSLTVTNGVSASTLTGTLQTGSQPNITATGTLLGIDIDGSLTGLIALSINTTTTGRTLVLNGTSGNCLQLVYNQSSGSATNYVDMLVSSSGDLSITSSGGSVDVTTHNGSTAGLKLGGTLITATADQLNYLQGTTPGTAAGGKAVIVDSSRNISNLNNLTASQLTGTLQTAAQPNINAVNVLNISNHNGSTLGLKLNGTLVTATATELNYVDMTPGTASASKALVLDSSSDISGINSLSANYLTGTLQTGAQPNITSVSVLDITDHDGGTQGLKLAGVLVTATAAQLNSIVADDGDGNFSTITVTNTVTITNADGSSNGLILGSTLVTASADQLNYTNVTPGSASANKALVLDGDSDISGINSLSANDLYGTIQTTSQTSITSVGTLDSLTIGGNLTMGSTVIADSDIAVVVGVTHGTASADKALIIDNSGSISGINSLSATDLYGTIQTASQPNITSVSVLDITDHNGSTLGLKLDGTLVTATATQLNYTKVTAGTATASKALVLDSSSDIAGIHALSATNLTGTLQTAAQTNITSVGTLTSITTSGSLTMGSTVVSAGAIGVIVGVTAGTASASKALVLDSSSDIAGIHALSATNLTGTLQTASQPNITSVGTLDITNHDGASTGLKLSGTLVIATAAQLNYTKVGLGTATANKALVLDGNLDVTGIHALSATNLTGTLQTASQPNITSVGTLDITNHDGASTGLKLSGTLVTATAAQLNYTKVGLGTATASKALVLDGNLDVTGIHALSATNLTGTLQTASQPNITSVGTLTSITTSGTLTLGSTAVSEGDIGVIVGVTAGTASASKALVLDGSADISGINSLGSSVLAIGSPANSNLPIEVGYTTYQFSGAYAYNNDVNAHGIIDAGSGPSANYSLRADGRILVTGEVEITSDRRLKKDIVDLTPTLCKSFVMSTTPVRFNWRGDDEIPDYGYIAQDVLKAGFDDLVTVVPHPGMEGSTDDDGFVNPANGKFVFSPGKIIPMLALNQRNIFEAQDAKDVEISNLTGRLVALEALVAQLLQKK